MSIYSLDSEGAISAVTAGSEFDVFDGDSSKRIKKATAAQVLSYVQQNVGAVVDTTATTLAVTAASHASKIITISSSAPLAITLPQAIGTGNRYRFVLMVAATATQHTIKVANSTDVMQGYVWALTTSSANVIGYGTSASSDTITLNGSTTGGVAGSDWEIIDVAIGKFQVHGNDAPTGSTATPFSATV